MPMNHNISLNLLSPVMIVRAAREADAKKKQPAFLGSRAGLYECTQAMIYLEGVSHGEEESGSNQTLSKTCNARAQAPYSTAPHPASAYPAMKWMAVEARACEHTVQVLRGSGRA
jgi:hypothetical protein